MPAHSWEYAETGVDSGFRALSAVDARCVWLASLDGRVLRSVDGGRDWLACGPPETAGRELRAIVAFDALTAIVMSPGPGEEACLHRTADGGASWTRVFRATDPECYLDGVAFLDRRTGVVIGDPVGGRFTVLRTTDGGCRWERAPAEQSPPALPGEGAFAASGSCIIASDGRLYFGTGGAAQARIFRSADGGARWEAHAIGMRSAPMAGVFGLHFADATRGYAVGGDHSDQQGRAPAFARTASGGETWSVGAAGGPHGYRSAVTVLPDSPQTVVVVGQSGCDISYDGGTTWRPLEGAFHAISAAPDGSCWAAGEHGRVARLVGR